MQLVKNWKKGYKWLSVQCMLIATLLQSDIFLQSIIDLWNKLPIDMKASLPDGAISTLTTAILTIGLITRFINQTKDDK